MSLLGKRVGLIWAECAYNRVIGKDGALPWSLPEDLAHFRRVTGGKAVIMGRRTWESLPVRPLPCRQNIVVTSSEIKGVTTARSLFEAVSKANGHTVWVIGGAALLEAALPYADDISITLVYGEFEGDTFAPRDIDFRRFDVVDGRTETSITGLEFSVHTLTHRTSQFDTVEVVE